MTGENSSKAQPVTNHDIDTKEDTVKGKQLEDNLQCDSATGEEKTRHTDELSDPDQRWEVMFQRLLKFKKQHKHCMVPNNYVKDTDLADWGK